MDTNSITRSVWLTGVRQQARVTLSGPDYTFVCMSLEDKHYPVLESSDGFRQWVYLVCPEAYHSAFRTRRPYILASNAFRRGYSIVWDVTVNHLVATCTGAGLRAQPRHFRLVFGRQAARRRAY